MLALNSLTSTQKSQLRNAFTIIDGDSRDSKITKKDLVALYKTLGLTTPTDAQLNTMLDGEEGINFTQYSNIMAKQLLKFDGRETIQNALKVFADELKDLKDPDFNVEITKLKEAVCSVQLGEIGTGDNRLGRKTFDELVDGFVRDEIDGRKVFMASKWLAAYIE